MRTRLSRADQSRLSQWFWTIDHVLLAMIVVLIGIGLIAVAAASPAAAHRYSGQGYTVSDLHYFQRQLFWVTIGLPVLLGVSMLSKADVKRVGLIGGAVALAALMLVPVIGFTVNGATRWLVFGPAQVQPSEFLKPLFIVAMAALLSIRFEDAKAPALALSAALLAIIAVFLIKQPDLGQTILFVSIWLLLATLAGLERRLIAGALALGLGGIVAAFFTLHHVHERIVSYVTGGGDRTQVDAALNCFRAGGLFGVGPGAGKMKMKLPEPQTDYIFAVIGEEFGAIACIAIACLFVAVVVRAVSRAHDEEDPFVFLASIGLAAQLGLQAAINMGVNVHLLPSKGMTLPFISHGGSSFVALCLGTGLLLALGRRNPYAKASPYRFTPVGARA
ncbi:MAG: FtsW/RodA/SpoVE family cell cycle protein [Sphingomonadaceae bacterium]|nr:FtsW/RodA/SpoVE family cell cycle protein [Sphingomonadaceae bacterium]